MTRKNSLKILLKIKTLVEVLSEKNYKEACEFQFKQKHFKDKQEHFEWLTLSLTKSPRHYQI